VARRDFHVWDEVPPGSRLWLRLEVEGAVLARACAVLSADGVPVAETELPHVRLVEGGDAMAMEAETSGTVTVSLHFPAPRGTARLAASVIGPDGRPFKQRFEYEASGARGDTFRVILLLTADRLDLAHDGRTC
jgi:hypothetical protein